MKKNVIRLNGKLYDAETGKILSTTSTPTKVTAKPRTVTAPAKSSKLIDGFGGPIKPKSAVKLAPTKAQASSKTKPSTDTPTVKRGGKSFQTKPQRTTTLRRSSVTKPIVAKPSTSSATPPARKPGATSNVTNRNLQNKPNRSPLITRFNKPTSVATTTSSNKTITSQAKLASAKPRTITKATPKLSLKETLIAEKFAELDKAKPVESKKSRRNLKRHVKRHSKLAGIVTTGLAVILVGLYVVYLNVPNMAIKYAASRAGFDAVLPHYSPSGYSFSGPINYQPGQVTISFKSNSDERRYSVVEQPTNWDSEAVYDNYVSKQTNQPPYTIQDSGLTIYIFGKNNAAWTNAGKFYAINGSQAQLSTEQLQKIATSL